MLCSKVNGLDSPDEEGDQEVRDQFPLVNVDVASDNWRYATGDLLVLFLFLSWFTATLPNFCPSVLTLESSSWGSLPFPRHVVWGR